MADCVEISSEGSNSDASNPTPPPPGPTARRSPLATGRNHKEKRKHRGRKGKRRSKGKRRRDVTSSSSASSSSHDSTDSECPDSDHITSKKGKKKESVGTKQESKAYDSFQRHYNSLVALTSTCIGTITSKLFARKLISEDILGQVVTGQDSDQGKAQRVLYSIHQQVKTDPGKLKTLLEVLEEEPVFDNLTKEMISKYS